MRRSLIFSLLLLVSFSITALFFAGNHSGFGKSSGAIRSGPVSALADAPSSQAAPNLQGKSPLNYLKEHSTYNRLRIDPLLTQTKELSAGDAATFDQFGFSVDISGDTVVVGAFSKNSFTGAAYIFGRNQGGADNWGQVKKLTASDAATGDKFGFSVGINGDTVVVGAYRKDSSTGAAYIFGRNQGGVDNWGQVKRPTAVDATPGDVFGVSVGISGDTVVVGAQGKNSNTGAAYIFGRNQGGADNWGQVKKLTAGDAAVGDSFGNSVSISGDTVVVGASGKNSIGAAYIFGRNQGGADNWGPVKKPTASDAAGGDNFGSWVSISGDTVVVGASGKNNAAGAAYIFGRNQGGADNWGQAQKLTAGDAATGDDFGFSVGISGDTAVVGALGKNSFTGAAYIFDLTSVDTLASCPTTVSISHSIVNFACVNQAGTTTFTAINPSSAGTVPNGHTLCQTCPSYEITTTAGYSAPVTVCLAVPASVSQSTYSTLKLMHGESGQLVDHTTNNFTDGNSQRWVCGNVNSLSPFALAGGQTPTATVGTIGGKVTDNSGAPVSGATINLSGTESGETITDSQGNYNFFNVGTSGFYTITPARANYNFSPPSRSLRLLGVHTDASFTASPNGDHVNVIDTTEFFVRQQYLDFLGREPDPQGFNGWVSTLRNCAPGNASCDRIHVSESFFKSNEFQDRGYFVYRFYSTALGRKPDYAEFTPDLTRVSGFLTDGQLEAAKTQFANDFTMRAAFVNQYGALSNSQYVDALAQTAGVTLSNRQALIDSLNAGTMTRAQALRQIAESGAVYQRYYNQAFVVMEYFGYLRRDPDAAYTVWIDVLNADPTDSRHMVEGFVDSTEYRNRFKQ